jgi:hypothetical protein
LDLEEHESDGDVAVMPVAARKLDLGEIVSEVGDSTISDSVIEKFMNMGKRKLEL